MTVDDIEVLLKDTEHNGYPVVVSRENQYLVGFVLRKDLNMAIGKHQNLHLLQTSSDRATNCSFLPSSQPTANARIWE